MNFRALIALLLTALSASAAFQVERPKDLPSATNLVDTDYIVIDQGAAGVRKIPVSFIRSVFASTNGFAGMLLGVGVPIMPAAVGTMYLQINSANRQIWINSQGTNGAGWQQWDWRKTPGVMFGQTVTAYGAVGDGETDDTPAFNAAIAAVGQSGGEVFVPPGRYAINLTITNSSVVLHGSGAVNKVDPENALVPFDPTKPVIQIGSDDGSQQPYGVQLKNLYLFGSNTNATGLRIRAAYRCSYESLSVQGFTSDSLLLDGQGSSNAVTYQNFHDFVIEGGGGTGNAVRVVYDTNGVGFVTQIQFAQGAISSGSAGGHAIDVDGAVVGLLGVWIQAHPDHGIIFRKSGAYYPAIHAHDTILDGIYGPDVAVENTFSAGTALAQWIWGDFHSSGQFKNSAGTLTAVLDNYSYLPYQTQILYPQVLGTIGFPGSDAAPTNDVRIYRSGADLALESQAAVRTAVGTNNPAFYVTAQGGLDVSFSLQASTNASRMYLSDKAVWHLMPLGGGSWRVSDGNFNAKLVVDESATNSAITIDSGGATFGTDLKFSGGATIQSPLIVTPTLSYPTVSGTIRMPDDNTRIYASGGRIFFDSATNGVQMNVPANGPNLVVQAASGGDVSLQLVSSIGMTRLLQSGSQVYLLMPDTNTAFHVTDPSYGDLLLVSASGDLTSKGYIAMPNNTWLYGRNAANGANVSAIGIDSADQVSIASGGATTTIGGPLKVGNTPGITTTWTNVISGVITQRLSTVNGVLTENTTL